MVLAPRNYLLFFNPLCEIVSEIKKWCLHKLNSFLKFTRKCVFPLNWYFNTHILQLFPKSIIAGLFSDPSMTLGSLRCGRFRGDGDVTAQVDWARGCRSRAKINLLKILMTASATSSSTSAVLSEIQSLLFVAWPHLKIFDNFSFFTTTLI